MLLNSMNKFLAYFVRTKSDQILHGLSMDLMASQKVSKPTGMVRFLDTRSCIILRDDFGEYSELGRRLYLFLPLRTSFDYYQVRNNPT